MAVTYSEDEHVAMLAEERRLFGIEQNKTSLNDFFKLEGTRFTSISPKENVIAIKDWTIREDDILISTYSKSGTHWMAEIVLLMLADGHPEKIDPKKRLPSTIEMPLIPDNQIATYKACENFDSPRVLSSHLSWKFLPKMTTEKKMGKIIYVMRNPKDTLTSRCRFIFHKSDKGKEEKLWKYLFNTFLTEDMQYGGWFDHVQQVWRHKDQENVFFTTYEGLHKDFRSVVKALSRFLGIDLSEETLTRVEKHSTLQGMKNTYSELEKQNDHNKYLTQAHGTKSFIIKGTIGSWKNFFTVAENELFDEVCKEKIGDLGLPLIYE